MSAAAPPLPAAPPLALRGPASLLALVAMVLMALGLVMVYSASGARAGLENRRAAEARAQAVVEDQPLHHAPDYAVKQVIMACAGLALMIVAARVPFDWVERLAPWALPASVIVLCLVVFTPLGVEAKGARRWLRIGGQTLQPSEFAKIGLVLFMAWYLNHRREVLRDFRRGFLPTTGIVAGFCVLILLQKDLGTTALIGAVMLGMWIMARMKGLHLGSVALTGLVAGVALVFQHGYRVKRILAFMDPEKFASTYAYQLNQSLIAVGSGGVFGQGLGLGLQKYHFLSEAHTDFIFAIVCEELGFVGAASVVLLFLSFLFLGFRISYKAPDYFGSLVAAGLTMMIGWAAFINFFVVLGLAPTKGLALPFFSYGGTSIMATLLAVGLLINIGNYTFAAQRGGR